MLTKLHTRRGWDPFELARREFFRGFGEERLPVRGVHPKLSLWEQDNKLIVEVDVPGMRPGDVDVTMENGELKITGERRSFETVPEQFYNERSYGKFERVVRLSDAIDPTSIDANLRDGVLRVTLSRKPEAQPHRVSIKYDGSVDESPSSN